jgi:MFS family permease
MTSLCTQYYQLFLAQGVLLGLSMSLIFCPSMAVVLRRLPHRRGLAIGLTVGGSSIGGVIWPIMLEQLLLHDSLSFGWVLRIVAFTMLPLLAIACFAVADAPVVILAPNVASHPISDSSENVNSAMEHDQEALSEKPKKTKTDLTILRNRTFLLLCLGMVIVYLGLFTPFFYVSSYAIDLGMSSSTAFYLISAVNASSFFGRVIPGYLADKYGHFNLCTLSVLFAGVVGICWKAASSLVGLVIWCIAYGFASGVSSYLSHLVH